MLRQLFEKSSTLSPLTGQAQGVFSLLQGIPTFWQGMGLVLQLMMR